MQSIKLIIKHLTHKERIWLFVSSTLLFLSFIGILGITIQTQSTMKPIRGGLYTEGIVGQPVMVNPVKMETSADQDLIALLYAPLSELIETIESSPDGKQYAVKLKEDLFWSDGERLTSNDVLFTIELIQKLGNDSPLFTEWQGVSAVRASELQTTLTISQPYTFFKTNINTLRIVPQHIFGTIPVKNLHLSTYNLEPVGSGPYSVNKIEKRKDGFITEYKLKENTYYVGEKPFIPDFSVRFYPNINSLTHDAELRTVSGFGITNFIPDEIFKLPRIRIEAISMSRYYALFFNQTNNPILQNKELRSALGKAINKEKIVKETLKEQGARIEGPLLRSLLGIEPVPPSYDPEEAARKIGAISGIKLAVVVPEVPFLEVVAEKIREDWIAAGISEVAIYPIPMSDIQNVIQSRNYDVLLFGNTYKNPIDLFPFWHSSFRFFPGLNLSLYKNTEVDRALEDVRQAKEITQTQINQIIRVDEQITSDAPATFLFSLPYFYIHTTRMEGSFPELIRGASERFTNVSKWSVNRVRVLSSKTTTSTTQ
ncbi:MAG: ABC transporter substrate-binding protein [Candidatus Paceibacterota bacterium]|jgi:peptide/nickel transport system substrate-binding protein